MFELAEVALDEVALAVDAFRDSTLDQAIAWAWDVGLGSRGADKPEEGVRVIAAIGDDMTAGEAFQQAGRGVEIVALAGGKNDPDRQAMLIDQGVDLGAQSSTRTADGVILAPLFPPAACWWARMMELSINAIECGDFAASVSNTLTQTPALAQRLKRL